MSMDVKFIAVSAVFNLQLNEAQIFAIDSQGRLWSGIPRKNQWTLYYPTDEKSTIESDTPTERST